MLRALQTNPDATLTPFRSGLDATTMRPRPAPTEIVVNPRIRTLFLEKSITYFRTSLIQRGTKVSNTFFQI